MKVKQTRKRIFFVTFPLALMVLALASMPASAQRNPDTTPTPPPQAFQVSSTLYLPLVARQVNTDLTIGAIEVTQATQNLDNNVPLVAGKATVVRVYAQNNTAEAINGVIVSISATRGGSPLPQSPMTLGPKTITNSWSRGNLNTSFNFNLPTTWLSGVVSLQIRVDPNNTIPERNNGNNLRSFSANFSTVPALSVKVIPIEYIDTNGGLTFPPPSSISFIAPGLVKMFPISAADVTRHTAITFEGDLTSGGAWSRLLQRILDLKSTENAPASQIYYGLVPLFDESGNTWVPFGQEIFVGIGYVGQRASTGVTDASDYGLDGAEVANHEFGHNLGREHAPCNAPLPDRNYPYSGGLIGQYGLQISNLLLFDPNTYADIMSYCDPVWISDYTYRGLYNAQVAVAATAPISLAPVESLLVRAALEEDGSVQMDPAYTFVGTPDTLPAESEYSLELVDDQGMIIASYPLQMLNAEEEGVKLQAFHTMVAMPEQPFATLRITKKGELLAARSLTPTSQQPQAEPTIESGEQGTILRWGEADTPAIIRFTEDGGVTWTTLAVDYLGGQIILDTQALPEGTLHFEIILADQAGSILSLDWEHIR